MEDQGKRLLLAVVLALGIMMVWSMLFPPEQPEKTQDGDTAGETGDGADDKPAPGPTGEDGKQPIIVEPGPTPTTDDKPTESEQETRGEEQIYEFDFPAYRARFTSYGGTLKSWELNGDKYRETDKSGQVVQMDMVRTDGLETALPFAVRIDDMKWPEKTEWKGKKKSETEIEFTWSYMHKTPDGKSVAVFDLIKTYKLYPDDFLVELELDIINQRSKEEKQAVIVSLFGYQDPDEDTEGGWTQVESAWKSACLMDDEISTATVASLAKRPKQRAGTVRWGGIWHSYFLAAAAPRLESGSHMNCNSYGMPGHPGIMRTDLVFPVANMRLKGPPTTYSMVAYFGPKYLDKVESIDDLVGFNTGFGDSIDLGWLEFLSRPLLWLLQWFHSFLMNWGLAIVLLTILVKGATLPWTTKSMRSMRKMSKLRPQIQALQKKYKDDKQRQQVEMMNLYKAHGVNPLSGCLPMLLQMPIWFALYRMLMQAAELYHAPLITGWIDDLTAPDPYYLLPSALTLMMFVQMKLSPTTSDSLQQKILMYGMPVMIGGFSFFFPAGLTLYIFTNTLLTSLHHLWLHKTDPSHGEDKQSGKDAKPGKGKTASKHEAAEESVADASDASSDDDDDSDDDDGDGETARPARDRSQKRPSRSGSGGKKSRGRGKSRRGGKRKRGSGGKS